MNIQDQIQAIRTNNPDNIMATTFNLDTFGSMSAQEQAFVLKIIKSGLENPDSQVGAYAMKTTDYDELGWLLDPIIQRYHGISTDYRHTSDWSLQGNYDLRSIEPDLANVSMRIRVARNVVGFPLPGSMTAQDRLDFEAKMVEVFEMLIANPRYGGRYVSLTPNSPYHIGDPEYAKLVADHKMFKDMSNDPYLLSAGISSDWPLGRGMWESHDGKMIVWVNEEDQLRVVSMDTGSDLSIVFNNLRLLLSEIESKGVAFAISGKYGYVTSCPSNTGTGMRASIHVALPKLVKDLVRLKSIAKYHGLSVRGLGGEHTAYGEGGVVDISPRARLGKTEAEIVKELFMGIAQMLEEDRGMS